MRLPISTYIYGSPYAVAYAGVSYAEVANTVAYDFLEINILGYFHPLSGSWDRKSFQSCS